MRIASRLSLIGVLVGVVLGASTAMGAPAGCVDLLADCDPSSAILETLCGPGTQSVPEGGTSYVHFGATVASVTLTQCGTGATLVITSDTNLCDLPGGASGPGRWNDEICAIAIGFRATSAVPVLNPLTVLLLIGVLLGIPAFTLRRRGQTATP